MPDAPRPPSHAPGAWQRMHSSPDRFASWLASESVACHTGSRDDCAIMLVTHVSNGAKVGLKSEWQ